MDCKTVCMIWPLAKTGLENTIPGGILGTGCPSPHLDSTPPLTGGILGTGCPSPHLDSTPPLLVEY